MRKFWFFVKASSSICGITHSLCIWKDNNGTISYNSTIVFNARWQNSTIVIYKLVVLSMATLQVLLHCNYCESYFNACLEIKRSMGHIKGTSTKELKCLSRKYQNSKSCNTKEPVKIPYTGKVVLLTVN